MRPPARIASTPRSTVFAMFGTAAETALATRASSVLLILRILSVGNRSISTERGLRRSVDITCSDEFLLSGNQESHGSFSGCRIREHRTTPFESDPTSP